MVGSIDPRCETLRGTQWPVKVASVSGTRVAENHLGQRSPAASTGRTYGCKRSDQASKKLLRHGGRPHMGPCVRRGDGGGYRFTLACSAELCAASASLAEIAAVSAGLPQLGASLPSPQARGR